MSIELRPYQAELIEQVRGAFRGGARAVLMQLGTGGGKTATATSPIEECTRRGGKTVFLAHLDALLDDTHDRLDRAGVHVGIVQGDRPSDPTAPVQCASLQTLDRRGLAACPEADLVFLDEAHRAAASSVRRVLSAYRNARLIGLTATPQRGDGQPLGDVFEAMVCGPSNRWLTSRGYLVEADVLAPGAFSARGLVVDPVEAYEQSAPGSRAIVFATNKAHAEDLLERFEQRGWSTALLLGDTRRDRRRELKARMHAGDLQVLIGVGVFLEGWDLPSVETVILARAFGVLSIFLQAIGRGLRPSPETGKKRLTVLDLRGAVNLHCLPDEDLKWNLEGTAVLRTEGLEALARCKECFAVFRPQGTCPRCGIVVSVNARLPRVLSRAEKLANVSDLPQKKRDELYLGGIWNAVRRAPRLRAMPPHAQREFVLSRFRKRFGREPVTA